jgi:hypothetical protein
MSNKEAAIQLIEGLPDGVSVECILSSLRTALNGLDSTDPNADDSNEWWMDEMTDEEWQQFVCWGLRDELNDPREDIYTLDDGVPKDGPK